MCQSIDFTPHYQDLSRCQTKYTLLVSTCPSIFLRYPGGPQPLQITHTSRSYNNFSNYIMLIQFLRLTQLLMLANGLFYAAAFFINIFACRPRRKIWNPEIPGKCFDVTALYIASAVFNTFSDVAMLVVPIFMVWNLQMSTKRKIGISAIFGTGVFATICAFVRIKFQITLLHTNDYSYTHMQTGLLG